MNEPSREPLNAREPDAREEPRNLLKKVLIGIAVVWALGAAALLLVPRLSGTVDYRGLLIAQIETRTGRQVTIEGDVKMRLLPTPELSARDVRIANVSGAPSPDVIRAPLATFRLERAPLMAQKLKVTEVILDRPKIYLDVLPDGRHSWDLHPEKKPGKKTVPIDGFKAKDATILYRAGEAQMTLNGDLSWDGSGERPRVEASVKGGKIDLAPFLGPDDSGPEVVREGGKRWSDHPIDLAVLQGADGRIDIQADEIRYRRYLLTKPSLTARLEDGRLHIEQASAGLFGGEASVKGIVDARAVPALRLDVTLAKASVDKALSDWADTPFASGQFGMTANLQARGDSQYDMIRSLSGTVLLEAADGVVRGFDAAQLSADMAQLSHYADFIDLADTALAGGQTRYSKISGGLTFRDGVAELKGFTATLDASKASATGTVDLPRWAVDMEVSLSLTGREHARTPPVAMTLSGPLDSPDQKNHLGAVGKYVGKKLVKTVIDDALGRDEPRQDDLPPEERKEKTKRVVGKLIDKLERRRNKVVRQEPEPAYEDYPPYEEGYPSYEDENRSYGQDRYAAPRSAPGYRQDEYAEPPAARSDRRDYAPAPSAPSYRLEPNTAPQRQRQAPDEYDSSGGGDQGYGDDPPEGGYQQGYRPGPYYGPDPRYPDGRY